MRPGYDPAALFLAVWRDRSLNGKMWPTYVCGGCFVLVIVAVVFVRKALAFDFPLPWPDEAAFLSQAFAFDHTGSMQVYALNPDRILMWMPPAYMVFMGVLFKIFGFSFGLARWISAGCFVSAYAILLLVLARILSGWRLCAIAAVSVVVSITPYVIVDANVARMESLYYLLATLSLFLSVIGRPVSGMAVIAMTGVVHFNAVYFLLPYGVFALYCSVARVMPIRISRLDWIMIGVSATVLSAYLVFCVANREGLAADMDWQFSLKAGRSFRGSPLDVVLATLVCTLPVVQIGARMSFTPAVFCSLYGASFFLMALCGQEMWYRFGYAIGLLLAASSVLAETASASLARRGVGVWALLVLFAFGEYDYGYGPSPATASLRELETRQIISKGDREKVGTFIRSLPAGSHVSFSFGFNGIEPFFFQDLAASRSEWTMHTHSATQYDPTRTSDYRIRCDSTLYKKILNPLADGDYPRLGMDSGCAIIKWKPDGK